ncbi:MAG: tetratricopeptide repeat protein, partial [Chloroflexi bacterium]|nr:tetratricopeptide repeat protein [Chloroflexota bacterium]
MLRQRDDAVLRAVWGLDANAKPRQVLIDLEARYGFVQPEGTLHPVVRDFLRESLRADDCETANRLGKVMAEFYQPRWQSETDALPILGERLSERRWQNLTLDTLNALSWSDETRTMQFIAPRSIEALEFNWTFARNLVALGQEFRNAPDWWSSRTNRRFDSLTRAIKEEGEQAMEGLKALEREPSELNLEEAHKCILRMWRAQNLLKQGKPNDALNVSLEAETSATTDNSLRAALAETFAEIGGAVGFKRGAAVRSDEGLTCYEHAVALDSSKAGYHNGLGAMLNETGGKVTAPRAQQVLSDAINLDPQFAAAFNNRGNAYYYLKEYTKAIADYDRALALDPQDAVAYYNRGNAYYALTEYAQAIADYDRALALDPQYVN